VTSATPPGLELPKPTPHVRFNLTGTEETSTVNAGTTSTNNSTLQKPTKGTASTPRPVAGLFMASLLATMTLGQSLFVATTAASNPTYAFDDP